MVDPLSLTVNVLQIVQITTSTIKTIDHLITKYKNAPTKLASLRTESAVVRASLSHLQETFSENIHLAERLDAKPELKDAIDSTLTGCWAVFSLLDKDLQKLQNPSTGQFDWKGKAYLLFTEEIIHDYQTQIRGQVEGLSLLLHCMQLESVSETNAILRKADKFFSQIAQETLSIRTKHKDLDVPESIYHGRLINNEEQDFDFDDLVVNSKAYRDVMRTAKKTSVLDSNSGSASLQNMPAGESYQPQLLDHKTSRDILSDQLMTEASTHHSMLISKFALPSVPRVDPGDDLIDLSDEPPASSPPYPKHTSPGLMDMAGLIPEGYMSAESIEPPLERSKAAGPLEKRDSGQASMKRTSDIPSIVEPEEKIVYHAPIPEEKILVSSEESHDKRYSSGQRSSIASVILSGGSPVLSSGPYTPSIGSPDSLYQPPELHSPITPEQSFVNGVRPAVSSTEVPATDDDHESSLLQNMESCMASYDQNLRLDWAEDALRHCHLCKAHEDRKAKTQRPRTEIPVPEQTLNTFTSQFVNALANAGNARALFLKARYIEQHPSICRDNFLLASSKGYHRAHYYIGQIFEAEGTQSSREEAMRRYQSGAKDNDAACLYRISKAHFEGTLGVKKNQKEASRLLEQAVLGADKDFPSPLHHLASLQEIPPKRGLGLSKSFSKPQIKHDPQASIVNYRRAALFGHAPSQLRLGLAHRTGALSVPVDHNLSLHYLHLAARRGLAQADYEIANTLFWGSDELLARYPKRAYAHARRAARDEWSEAYALLGMAYENGVGVDRDVKAACGWYLKGASKGDRYAEKKVEILRGKQVLGFKR